MWRINALLFCISLASSASGSTRGGNGGEGSKAFDFHQHALMFIEGLERLPTDKREGLDPAALRKVFAASYIKPVKTCDANGLDGKKIDKPSACNFPSADPKRIEVTDAWPHLSKLTKIGIAGHELAGLLKIEINTYNLTSPIMLQLKDTIEDDADPFRPRLLDQIFTENDHSGMSVEQANKRCEKVRRLSLSKYFYVYCEVVRKNWREEVPAVLSVADYQFMGYEYIRQHAHSEIALRAIYLGSHVDQDIRRPVIRRVERIVPITRVKHSTIFGLKVFGLGRYRKDLPFPSWKQTLVDSSQLVAVPDAVDPDISHVIEEQTYAAARDALRVCTLTIRTAMRKEPAKYYRSQCGLGKTEDDRFYFVIKTQNPFIHEDF